MSQKSIVCWDSEAIRAQLRRQNGSLKAFARQSRFSLSAICACVNGRDRLPGPCAAIAEALCVQKCILWPNWYDVNDRPLNMSDRTTKKRHGEKTTRFDGSRHDQKREAA